MMRVAELEKQLLQREKELESIKVPVRGGEVGRPPLTQVPAPQGFFSSQIMSREDTDLCAALRQG